jgi:hypothetical protein
VTQRELWQGIRRILLDAVTLIEKWLGIQPTTAEIRRWWKER